MAYESFVAGVGDLSPLIGALRRAGGWPASGAPARDRLPTPWRQPAELLAREGCGEVQTPVRLENARPALGEPVLFRPAKAGELAEHFDEYLLVSAGKVVGREKTYRGLGRCLY